MGGHGPALLQVQGSEPPASPQCRPSCGGAMILSACSGAPGLRPPLFSGKGWRSRGQLVEELALLGDMDAAPMWHCHQHQVLLGSSHHQDLGAQLSAWTELRTQICPTQPGMAEVRLQGLASGTLHPAVGQCGQRARPPPQAHQAGQGRRVRGCRSVSRTLPVSQPWPQRTQLSPLHPVTPSPHPRRSNHIFFPPRPLGHWPGH